MSEPDRREPGHPDALAHLVAAGRRALGAEIAGLGVYGTDGTPFERVGRSMAGFDLLSRLAGAEGAHRETWHDDVSGSREVLAVPIRDGGRTIGALYVADGRPSPFGPHDERVLTALADTASGMLERPSPQPGAERGTTPSDVALPADVTSSPWVAAAHSVTTALLAGEDPTITMHLIADRARSAAGATAAAIARPYPELPDTLVFDVVVVSPGIDAGPLVGLTVPLEGTATGEAFATGRAVVVRAYGERVADQQSGSGVPTLPAAVKDLDSAVSVPLTVAGERLGVLTVSKYSDREPFSDTDVDHVRAFAEHAALALGFARAGEDRHRVALLEDRDRIARDLHDLVIQRLFATGLGLAGLSRQIDRPDLGARVEGFIEEIDRTILELRNSIFALQERPFAGASLRSEVWSLTLECAEAFGFRPRVSFEGAVDHAVPEPVWPDLLATVREALSNAARHGASTAVAVEVVVDARAGSLTLSVIDDGTGMPPHPGRRSGLANLAERARRWGGTLSVEPGGSGGTLLRWAVPISPNAVESSGTEAPS